MTDLERFRNLVYGGESQLCGIRAALFLDPVTGTSFHVAIGESIGPKIDEIKRIWGKEGESSCDDPLSCDCLKCREYRADLDADRKYDMRRER